MAHSTIGKNIPEVPEEKKSFSTSFQIVGNTATQRRLIEKQLASLKDSPEILAMLESGALSMTLSTKDYPITIESLMTNEGDEGDDGETDDDKYGEWDNWGGIPVYIINQEEYNLDKDVGSKLTVVSKECILLDSKFADRAKVFENPDDRNPSWVIMNLIGRDGKKIYLYILFFSKYSMDDIKNVFPGKQINDYKP